MNNHFFATTPEAVLRAESVLTAFREGREGDIAAMLTTDQDGGTNPWELMVALIGIADRAIDYAATLSTERGYTDDPATLTREAARVVAEAVYTTGDEGGDSPAGDGGGR